MDASSTEMETRREYPRRIELLVVTVSLDVTAPDQAQLDAIRLTIQTFCRERVTCFFGDDADVEVFLDAGSVKGKVRVWLSATAIIGLLTQAGSVAKATEDLYDFAHRLGNAATIELAYRTECRNISAISSSTGSEYLSALRNTVGCLQSLEPYALGKVAPSASSERLVNVLIRFERHARELSSFHGLQPIERESVKVLDGVASAAKSDHQLTVATRDDIRARVEGLRKLFKSSH